MIVSPLVADLADDGFKFLGLFMPKRLSLSIPEVVACHDDKNICTQALKMRMWKFLKMKIIHADPNIVISS